MSWTAAQVQAIAPEFNSLTSGEVNNFIAYALLQHNATFFGGRSDYAGTVLTAHLLALAHPELSQGAPVSQEQVGQVRVIRALNSFDPTALHTTRHGIEYRRQIRLSGAGFQVL